MGTIAGGFFAGLIGQHYGWRWSFFVFGGLGVAIGFALSRLLREPQRGAADLPIGYRPGAAHAARLGIRESLGEVWTNRTALTLMGAFVCANFVAVVLLGWMPNFLYDKFHMSLGMAGLTATIFVQLASWRERWRAAGRRTGCGRAGRPGACWCRPSGCCGAPFVALCGLTASVRTLVVALTAWGFCKGLYDANIFASLFDVVRPEARGTAAGWMNTVGWLGGGGAAPLAIGIAATRYGLGFSIALASGVYLVAGALLLTGAFGFATADAARMEKAIAADGAEG